MNFETAVPAIIQVVVPIFLAVFGLFLIFILRAIKQRTDSEAIRSVLTFLETAVGGVVAEIGAEQVAGLRDPEGKIGAEKGKELKENAIHKIERQLSPALMKNLGKASADPRRLIASLVEKHVTEQKAGAPLRPLVHQIESIGHIPEMPDEVIARRNPG